MAVRTLSLDRKPLVSQQPLLAFDPPGVAGQSGIRANNAMTRQHNRNRIERVCSSNGAIRCRLSKFRRQLAVAHRRSHWNSAQRPPDLLLEGRTPSTHRDSVQAAIIACEIVANAAAEAIWIFFPFQVD